MKTLTEKQKERLRLIIKALRIIKKDYLAKTRIEFYHSNRHRGLCSAITLANIEGKISEQTENDLRKIVQKALKGKAYLDYVFQELNPTLAIYKDDLQYKMRHKWVNQLIRDYTKMLKA